MGGNVDNVIEVVNDDLVTGDITDGSQQYSPEIDTTTLDVDVAIFEKTIENPYADDLIWDLLLLEFNLALSVRAVSTATADLIWKLQARNKSGTWVDLLSAVTETDVGTAFVERQRGGFILPVTNLNEVPFDVRLILQCNETNEGRGRLAGASWVRHRARRKLGY